MTGLSAAIEVFRTTLLLRALHLPDHLFLLMKTWTILAYFLSLKQLPQNMVLRLNAAPMSE